MTTLACPKHMVHGPCGGVQPDGTCEVVDQRCSYVDLPVHPFDPAGLRLGEPSTKPQPGDELRGLLTTGRVVVADFPAVALDATSIQTTADILRGSVHAVLAGDSPRNRVQFPPSYRARLIQDAGLHAWAGVNCRDRNRVAIEGELAALAHLGAAAVHCVTGDHPGLGSRPDTAAVFDLDSTQAAARAHDAGLLVSVGESPASPPVELRPARLVEKLLAGAEVCFVNHCGGMEPVRELIAAVDALGGHPWFV
ncbi:MAG: methylenetetrahydrofolate reductase C-terminal domain-containing protein, partial [Propionibacteriaceae bacterium]